MLSFSVYSNGRPASQVDLAGAYLIGSDDVPLRGDISFKDGVITCQKRAAGPAGLAILWDVADCGRILTETVRLQERDAAYVLQVELARGRLMRIAHKLEDWGLYGYAGTDKVMGHIHKARDLFIKALQAESPAKAAALGEESLAASVRASEALSRFHADIFLGRRTGAGALSRNLFGCRINPRSTDGLGQQRLASAFDFVTLPLRWKELEPSEQNFQWKPLDGWVESLSKGRIPLKGSPLVSFDVRHVPEWLYAWEHDFDTLRDMTFEHIRRIINRYGQHVQMWDVISGVHANCCFSFNFEQLLELTRMAAACAKQLAPRATTIIDIILPWGEYYARNPRTIPPLLYADMVVQSGVAFDAFGLQLYLGVPAEGMYVRDMFQVSSLLDQFGKLGKPLHVTAAQVPSAPSGGARGDQRGLVSGGAWHGPWSESLQAEWLREFVITALSKPFVESISWDTLTDDDQCVVPTGGLLRPDLVPKAAYEALVSLRGELRTPARSGPVAP